MKNLTKLHSGKIFLVSKIRTIRIFERVISIFPLHRIEYFIFHFLSKFYKKKKFVAG